ncbi:hypothetical protein PV326_000525, partial [Microctonus aethiopoides]
MMIHNNNVENSDNEEIHEDNEELQVASFVNDQVDDSSEDDGSVNSIESILSVDADEPTNDVNDEELGKDLTTIDDFKKRLSHCFVNADLSHSQANRVLTCLRTMPNLCTLPKDAWTILQTPRTPCQLQLLGIGAKYLYLGFEAAVLDILRQTPVDLIPNRLKI